MDQAHLLLLQNMPIFGGLTDDTLRFMLERAGVISVPKGQYFFREDDPAESMYVLESGQVSVLKDWKGTDYVLRYLRAGDCFGEMALLDLFPRSASVLATADCTVLELSTALLHEVCRQAPEQCALVYMNIARELSRRLRAADQRVFLERVERGRVDRDWVFHAA